VVLTTGRLLGPAVGVLLLLTGACAFPGGGPESASTTEPDTRADRLGAVTALAEKDPADLLDRVRRTFAATPVRAETTRSEDSEDYTYTFLAGKDAWRADSRAAPEDGGDGRASLLLVGEQACFDREFRSRLTATVASSYGVVEFDPQVWTCTPSGFGLNRIVTFDYTRQDPRGRIASLRVEPTSSPVVEEVDGQPLLRLRTAGTSEDGPLDPARPAYDLWFGADHRPVRLTTAGMRWDFDYPADVETRLATPPSAERGSYGYAVGPGQGTAKACRQMGRCPERTTPQTLTWGDGRH
jgi:hypothetical protein